jgi:hypothetical protein
MYRKKTSNPTIYGGNVESEVMYGAKRHKRAVRRKGKKNFGGIVAKPHTFGASAGIMKGKNKPKYSRKK